MSDARKAIVTDGAPAAIATYSQAVVAGGVLYCAGQMPLDPATMELVPGGVRGQTRRCLESLEAICAQAGARLSDATRITVYLTDLSTYAEMNEVYAEFFSVPEPPARATIGVSELPKGGSVEIDAIVVVDR
jgi:2-iminobutanoate/2-iminopropanoate deaminase